MLRPLAALSFALTIAGCASSPLALSVAGKDALQAESADKLCFAYALMKPAGVRAELERRQLFTAQEWQRIEKGYWWVGMSEAALLCSQGKPAVVNQTVTAAGVSSQYVFEECRSYCPRRYAYVRNGLVTALQQ
ncbi:hypothetical protein [Arenimonas sp.]|uniref:hypothetical protein n=1 Tax=Arenimonas sp. TaxID=1872635 RepID=UPI0025BE007A|nr:hypothetical protein [Arenimonas sp.]